MLPRRPRAAARAGRARARLQDATVLRLPPRWALLRRVELYCTERSAHAPAPRTGVDAMGNHDYMYHAPKKRSAAVEPELL